MGLAVPQIAGIKILLASNFPIDLQSSVKLHFWRFTTIKFHF